MWGKCRWPWRYCIICFLCTFNYNRLLQIPSVQLWLLFHVKVNFSRVSYSCSFHRYFHVNVFEADLESRGMSVPPAIPGRSHKGSALFGVGSSAAGLVIKTQRSESRQKKTSGWIDGRYAAYTNTYVARTPQWRKTLQKMCHYFAYTY